MVFADTLSVYTYDQHMKYHTTSIGNDMMLYIMQNGYDSSDITTNGSAISREHNYEEQDEHPDRITYVQEWPVGCISDHEEFSRNAFSYHEFNGKQFKKDHDFIQELLEKALIRSH